LKANRCTACWAAAPSCPCFSSAVPSRPCPTLMALQRPDACHPARRLAAEGVAPCFLPDQQQRLQGAALLLVAAGYGQTAPADLLTQLQASEPDADPGFSPDADRGSSPPGCQHYDAKAQESYVSPISPISEVSDSMDQLLREHARCPDLRGKRCLRQRLARSWLLARAETAPGPSGAVEAFRRDVERAWGGPLGESTMSQLVMAVVKEAELQGVGPLRSKCSFRRRRRPRCARVARQQASQTTSPRTGEIEEEASTENSEIIVHNTFLMWTLTSSPSHQRSRSWPAENES